MAQTLEIKCSDEVFSGLVALFNAVIFRKFPESIADPGDLEEMIDMLQTLRPELPEVAMLRGLVAVLQQDWQSAAAIFVSLRERRLCVPSSDAMAAFCLSSLGDTGWHAISDELLASGAAQESHRQLISALVARHDLERATREASVKGVYNEPDSVRVLVERSQRAQEAALTGVKGAAMVSPSAMPAGVYLRV